MRSKCQKASYCVLEWPHLHLEKQKLFHIYVQVEKELLYF